MAAQNNRHSPPGQSDAAISFCHREMFGSCLSDYSQAVGAGDTRKTQ